MEVLVGILLLVLLVRWIIIFRRFGKLNRRIEELSSHRGEPPSEAIIHELEARVGHLESIVEHWLAEPSGSEVATEPEPVYPASVQSEEPLPTVASVQAVPAAEEAVPPSVRAGFPAPEASTLIVTPPTAPKPSALTIWRQRIREQMAGEEWEAVIGGSWLNKIGIVVLVIGVALFLGYSLRYMGPIGRVATGVVTSLALLLGGVHLERVERYTLFAKPLIGGGWALLYFTGYAAYSLEAAKVIREPIWGVVLLGLIAAGMILHSLKYRSEIVTGFAYFPGFLTVAISPITGFTLLASFILAASLVLILRKARWNHLALFGIAATYLNHAIWLEFKMGGFASRPPLDTFWLSQGMLILYWLLFAAFDFISQPGTKREEQVGVGINLANTVAFLALSFRQAWPVFPAYRYLFSGAAGLAYVVSSFLLYALRRRRLHLINAVVAASLIAIAIPLKPPASPLAKHWLGVAWLLEGAVLLALGVFLREMALRVQAYILSLAALGALFSINLYSHPDPPHLLRWLTVSPPIAYFYFLFGELHKKWRSGELHEEERSVGVFSCYMASALLALLLWREVSAELVGLSWLAAAVMLCEAGIRSRQAPFWRTHIRIQGYVLSALALAALLLVNLYGFYGQPEVRGLSRWIIVPPAILASYSVFWRFHRGIVQGRVPAQEGRLADLLSYAASALLTVLFWKQLDAAAVALAWAVLGLLLVEAGIGLDQMPLKVQGHAIIALGVGRLFLANFAAPGEIFGLSHRLITVVPIVAILYYLRSRVSGGQGVGRGLQIETRLPQAYSYAAATLLFVLVRFEFSRALAVIGWAALGLVFLIIGILRQDRDFRIQSYLLAGLTFWRSWSTNFYLIGTYYGIPERIATSVPVIAAFYACKLLCLFKRQAFPQAERGQSLSPLARVDINARILYSLLASALLTLLLYYEMQGNLLTITWTVEGFVLLALGFLIRERTFRLSGLSLLMVCLLKVFLIDLRGVETLHRIFSFIVLGVILLLVSFGYTRYKELLRKYL